MLLLQGCKANGKTGLRVSKSSSGFAQELWVLHKNCAETVHAVLQFLRKLWQQPLSPPLLKSLLSARMEHRGRVGPRAGPLHQKALSAVWVLADALVHAMVACSLCMPAYAPRP